MNLLCLLLIGSVSKPRCSRCAARLSSLTLSIFFDYTNDGQLRGGSQGICIMYYEWQSGSLGRWRWPSLSRTMTQRNRTGSVITLGRIKRCPVVN